MRKAIFLLPFFLGAAAQAQVAVSAVHPGFDLINFRPAALKPDVSGMDFFPNGDLAVCTWGGQRNQLTTPSHNGNLYIIHGASGNGPVTYETAATGLEEPLGLKIVDGEIYLTEREQLARFTKTGSAWARNGKVCDAPGGALRSEWFYGLDYKDGFFYANFALNFADGGTIITPQPHQHRGTVARIDKATGAIEYLAGGLRTADGMTLDPRGEIYLADNQGEWLPSCSFVHVVKGRQYGVQPVDAQFKSLAATPPTLWIPYNRLSKSSSQPIYIPSGPYAGQFYVGDVVFGGLQRVFLETVNGEEQGGVVAHSQGLEAGSHRMVWGPDGALYVGGIGTGDWVQKGKLNWGLQKLNPNGKSVYEILAVWARKGGMEVQFTQAVGASATAAASWEVKIWHNVPSSGYGAGNESNSTAMTVKSAQLSPDKKSVFLAIDGLKEGWVTYIHLLNVPSAAGDKPWSSEAFYTLNHLGTADPFTATTDVRAAQIQALRPWSVAPAGRGLLRVQTAGTSPFSVSAYDYKGALLAKAEGRGSENLRLPEQARGACLIKLSMDGRIQSRLVMLP